MAYPPLPQGGGGSDASAVLHKSQNCIHTIYMTWVGWGNKHLDFFGLLCSSAKLPLGGWEHLLDASGSMLEGHIWLSKTVLDTGRTAQYKPPFLESSPLVGLPSPPPWGGGASDISTVVHKSQDWPGIISRGPMGWANTIQHF